MFGKSLAKLFVSRPMQIKIRGWQINYLCFNLDKHIGVPPIVFLGGAFQKFSSFRHEVSVLSEHFPVILVDLPGQGNNEQDAQCLGFEDLAILLKDFLNALSIDRITPLALSYGSAIGLNFAHFYPERTYKLILGGTTSELRPSVRYLLEESLEALSRKDYKSFSAGVVLNLMNYSKRSQLPYGELLAKKLYNGMCKLTDNERNRYLHNTQRLLDLKSMKKESQCETLVLAGEFDNFTTPFESFSVAKECDNSVFVVVRGADHLAPYQKKSVVTDLFLEFLQGKRFEKTQEYFPYRKDFYNQQSRQLDDRYEVNQSAFIRRDDGMCYPVNLKNINTAGCCFETGFLDDSFSYTRKYWLDWQGVETKLPMILFKNKEHQSHAVFIKDNFERYKMLESKIESFNELKICA